MTATATISRRPALYHTPRSCPLALVALRRLWALGLTDARIAELLSGLTADGIRTLKVEGWTVERAEDLAGERSGSPWTPRQVLHHRHRLGMAARTDGLDAARAALAYLRRRYQADAGWGHLLPSADDPGAGIVLRRREVQLLCLLRDGGTMTRGQLHDRMGVRHLMARGRSLLARLVRVSLVRPQREAGGPLVFTLGKAAGWPARGTSLPRQQGNDDGDEWG